MVAKSISLVLAAVILLHAVIGGQSVAILCLGGGHEHEPAEKDHCAQTCGHDADWPQPLFGVSHDRECGCIDVAFALADLAAMPCGEDGPLAPLIVEPNLTWWVVAVETGLGRRGPPVTPPRFDPGGEQRLAIVASVRLTI